MGKYSSWASASAWPPKCCSDSFWKFWYCNCRECCNMWKHGFCFGTISCISLLSVHWKSVCYRRWPDTKVCTLLIIAVLRSFFVLSVDYLFNTGKLSMHLDVMLSTSQKLRQASNVTLSSLLLIPWYFSLGTHPSHWWKTIFVILSWLMFVWEVLQTNPKSRTMVTVGWNPLNLK